MPYLLADQVAVILIFSSDVMTGLLFMHVFGLVYVLYKLATAINGLYMPCNW